MSTKQHLAKLRQIITLDSTISEIFHAKKNLEDKRLELRNHFSCLLFSLFDETIEIPSLEWIACRDATWVMRNILAKRSEELAGFSVLKYINTHINSDSPAGVPKLSPDFLAELEHLILGIKGNSGIYKEKPPAFLRHSGRKAAKMRSTDLSRMARKSERFLKRYPSSLDPEMKQQHLRNRKKIQEHFGISDMEWNDWRWHTKNIIRDAETMANLVKLSEKEYTSIKNARRNRLPFGVTPYYLSLMNQKGNNNRDRAIRAQVIPPPEYVTSMIQHRTNDTCSMDFMLENDTSPIEGITRRYPNIVILKPILTCPQICVYCQRNWQIEDVYSKDAMLSNDKLGKALQWIEDTPEIQEVLITGGDPFLLEEEQLEKIFVRLASMDHVIRIRLGTRTLVTLPQRITDSLVRTVARFHVPGRREVIIVTHFEHPSEITPEAMNAAQKFRLCGIDVYNQLVYTYYNSRKFEAVALRQALRLIGVTPYYTFNTKGKQETARYKVPIARLLQEQQEEARLMPGTVRTDEIVFNVPQLGKNYLRAAQNRDVISFLPDGRRVYEFHPWEKKLALVNTFVYTDVSIYQYLRQLKRDGEQVKDYDTIWYYY